MNEELSKRGKKRDIKIQNSQFRGKQKIVVILVVD